MRRSLWLKLMGVFAVIIGAGVIITIAVVNVAVSTQFERFSRAGDLIQAQEWAQVLADYYRRQDGWAGVEQWLRPSTAIMGGGMMGGMSTQEMQEMMGADTGGLDRVALANARGVIIADTAGLLLGELHPAEHLAQGRPILVNGQRVGTVLVGSMIEPALNPLDADFLRSVNLAALVSAMAVGVLALILGSFLFFHITSPVRAVTAAAEAIAAGDMKRRVQVRTEDEVGRLAVAFNSMADALQRQEALRQALVNDIAHELRTPLSLMQGTLEAMLDGYYDLTEENLAAVHQDTRMMARLVEDLRLLSLAESGQLTLRWEWVNIRALLADVRERFHALAIEQEIHLQTELPATLPLLRGDPQRLEQIVSNLLSNALRHTPAGGTVTVGAAMVGDELEIVVADTGAGLAAADLPNLFERFYRADRSRTRASGGSGLGLAIAKQLVAAHGGRIWAESPGPGQGSRFLIHLPGPFARAGSPSLALEPPT